MAHDSSTDTQQPNFEQAMQQLELVVQEMERGELPLDVALGKFQEGITLARSCQRYLKNAEQQVSVLAKDNATLEVLPTDESDSDHEF
jgi:exodeoxyribonuclease VII small subunit